MLFYSCIAKGFTILGDFSNQEPGIESLALQCIEKTPSNHSIFCHTVRNRSYTFLIDDDFTYFSICSHTLVKSESLWFLNRLKCGFQELLKSCSIEALKNYYPYCFQSQFDSIIGEIRTLELELKLILNLNRSESRLDISSNRRGISEGLKKKKRLPTETNRSKSPMDDVDVDDDTNGVYGKVLKKQQLWRKHVMVCVVVILFAIWLLDLKGFSVY